MSYLLNMPTLLCLFLVCISIGCSSMEKSNDMREPRGKFERDEPFWEIEGDQISERAYANKFREHDVMLEKIIVTIEEQAKTNQQQGAEIVHLHAQNQQLQSTMRELDAQNQGLEAKVKELEARNQKQDAKIEQHVKDILHSESKVIPSGSKLGAYTAKREGTVQSIHHAFACNLDIISLSCANGSSITVTSAYYAQFTQTCSYLCCPPHPNDCKESMEENAPGDWYVLTSVCNNQTSCQFENPGIIVPSCVEPYYSNYALVYYSCSPDDPAAQSAFTASIDYDYEYHTDDVIIFDVIITNVGNNYLAETSTYVCPRHGLYVFAITLYNVNGYWMAGDLMHDDRMLATARTDLDTDNQGSVTVVIECGAGEHVWVRSKGGVYKVEGSTTAKYNIFSGFLLQSY